MKKAIVKNCFHGIGRVTFLTMMMIAVGLCISLPVPSAHACTSWVASGSATRDGNMSILHKNRDTTREHQIVTTGGGGDLYQWIGTKSVDQVRPNAGVNEKGLAIVRNQVSGYCPFGTPEFLVIQNVLEMFSTVGDETSGALGYLLNQLDPDDPEYDPDNTGLKSLRNGGIYILADQNIGVVVEINVGLFGITDREYSIIENDAAGRSNHYIDISDNPSDHSEIRYERITAYLNNKMGDITPLDSFAWSRKKYSDNEKEGCICNTSTVSGTTFVLNDHPCMWVAIGSPDSSVYVPVHIEGVTGESDISSYLGDGTSSIWPAAENISDTLNPTDVCLTNYLMAWEAGMYAYADGSTLGFQTLDHQIAEDVYDLLSGITTCQALPGDTVFLDDFSTSDNWNSDMQWFISDEEYVSSSTSIKAGKDNDGDIEMVTGIVPPLDAKFISVKFYLNQFNTDDDDIYLKYYIDGEEFIVDDLYSGNQNDWNEYEFIIVDENILIADELKIGFEARDLVYQGWWVWEKLYVDDVEIKAYTGESLY